MISRERDHKKVIEIFFRSLEHHLKTNLDNELRESRSGWSNIVWFIVKNRTAIEAGEVTSVWLEFSYSGFLLTATALTNCGDMVATSSSPNLEAAYLEVEADIGLSKEQMSLLGSICVNRINLTKEDIGKFIDMTSDLLITRL